MRIHSAISTDAAVIHDVMIQAFMVYKNETPPSSALEETVQSIADAMRTGENALIAYEENEPVGMVRFQLTEEGLYFFRLSVLPDKQGKGIAKMMLKTLEDRAKEQGMPAMLCKVRMAVAKNIQLYKSIGYRICEEESIQRPNGVTLPIMLMKKVL
ncbi:GNAT family N-acetyltransferase [Sporosarcina sp. FSL W7-1349]|uniref:GNAT family N-acetyltransferase n=2 Tax=Sporosarcina sp. FSL W7-1349 TaxID=2921561 RepID=UPI0030F643C8